MRNALTDQSDQVACRVREFASEVMSAYLLQSIPGDGRAGA
jgi:hypothetical protein